MAGRARIPAVLFAAAMLPYTLPACTCETSLGTCREAARSDLIFTGTVAAIEPAFLSRWNVDNRSSLQAVNQAYTEAQAHPGDGSLTKLKATYLAAVPDLDADEKQEIQGAKSVAEVAALFDYAVGKGMRVKFRVLTMYKREGDDDKDDDDKVPEYQVVSTPFGDCGFDFQMGETYLVYADNEEATNEFFTGSCTRTRRLTDAGDDLPYLFFYKEHPDASSRVEGFTTADNSNSLRFDRLHEPDTVKAPVAGAVVELHSDALTRYAQSDARGRFVFDGLAAGDYTLSAYAEGYPLDAKQLAGPVQTKVEKKSCSLNLIVINER